MFYVNHRWLGGTLTNWATLQKSIKRFEAAEGHGGRRPHGAIFEEGSGAA